MILIFGSTEIDELLSGFNITNSELGDLISYRIYRQYCIDSGVYSISSKLFNVYCQVSNSHEFYVLDAVVRYAMIKRLYACKVKVHNTDIYIKLIKEGTSHVAWPGD